MIDDVVRQRIAGAVEAWSLDPDRFTWGSAADAVIEALDMEQYGEGWHHNRLTNELTPTDDEGNHTRLYRLWALDEPTKETQ